MTSETFYIGMDLGGTTFKAIAVTQNGHILGRAREDTDAQAEPAVVIRGMVRAIQTLQAKLAPSGRLQAVGFGVPGILDLPYGTVRRSPNLPRWCDLDLRAALAQHLDIPFSIENDANAALLGEMWRGAGRDMTHVVMLTLGTGVGGGIVVNGEILHGARGYAGELGHTVVDPNGPRCGCGSAGCLEQFASGTAISRLAAPHYGEVTAETVAMRARQGDAQAIAIYHSVGHALGIACANFANLFNPQRIVLGGAVAKAFDLFITAMQETMQQRAFAEIYDSLRIVPAICGTDAGGLGAAYQAMQSIAT